MTLKGIPQLQTKLAEIAERMTGGEVAVGFMEGATYPDGTPVAAVAYWNEYGRPGQPPRPFFRQMIATKSPEWGATLAKALKATGGDVEQALGLMGEKMSAELVESIHNFTTPALAPSTIKAKGFAKPLVDTNHMVRSVQYEVKS